MSELTSRRVVLGLWLPYSMAYFLSFWLRNINAVLAPDLTKEFALSGGELGLLTAAYSLPFALAQLPGGMLLDRFGPRRVNAALLLLGVMGLASMAIAQSFVGLTVGRALAGLGVSMCLMASIKAFSQWLGPARLPLSLSLLLTMGGLGGLVATVPAGWALQFIAWRGLFGLASGAMLGVLLFIFYSAPERRDPAAGESVQQLLFGLREVFMHGPFWRVNIPLMALAGTYQAFLSVWIGPWMRDVGGYDSNSVVSMVAWVALATTLGFALYGLLIDFLLKRGFAALAICKWHLACSLTTFALIVVFGGRAAPLWFVYFTVGTGGALAAAMVSAMFPPLLNGRANTAANMLSFLATFALQWGIGAALDLFPTTDNGHAASGYQQVCGGLLVLQLMLFFTLILPLKEIRLARTGRIKIPA